MNHYEELGLSQSATTDQVRQAYRNLARLLHPDRFQDDDIKQMAECQMKRINGVCAVLLDPARRSEYDERLEAQFAPPPRRYRRTSPSQWMLLAWQACRQAKPHHAVWVVAAVVGLACLGWLLREAPAERLSMPPTAMAQPLAPEPPSKPSATANEPRAPDQGSNQNADLRRLETAVDQLSEHLRATRVERDVALLRIARLEERLVELTRAEEPKARVPDLRASPPISRAAPPPPADAVSPSRPTVAGSWLYSRPPQHRSANELYAPEYIETIVVEDGSTVRGRYRARYRVTDRAISPEVSFEFSGKRQQDSDPVPWSGAGGARGEVRLRLVSENRLAVEWIANDFGSHLGLGSGTAVLVRRRHP